jgi:hypothetical protein
MAQLKKTCSVTNGSQTVTIAGDQTARIKQNGIFMVDVELVPYVVSADSTYSSGTGLTTVTLTGTYQGTTNASAAGVFATDLTYPDAIPTIAQGDVGTAAVFTQAMYKIQNLIGSVSPAGFSSYAAWYNSVNTMYADILVKYPTILSSTSSATASATSAAASASSAATNATSITSMLGQAQTAAAAANTAWIASTSATSAEQLAAISSSFHTGAVTDAFLYDTSKDSDGGAWRKRCNHTTWYKESLCTGKWQGQQATLAATWAISGAAAGDFYQNTADGKYYAIGGTAGAPTQVEVFRGNKAEFPALALIVLEAARLVIYDATQPTLPMWMAFSGSSTAELTARALPGGLMSSVVAMNGSVYVASADTGSWWAGLWTQDFISDSTKRCFSSASNSGTFRKPGPLSLRNTAESFLKIGTAVIVNSTVYDVAVSVMYDAPSDAATGLPIPTVAAGTAGGVSILKHDGTVSNSTLALAIQDVSFNKRGELIYGLKSNGTTRRIKAYPGWATAGFSEDRSYYNAGIPAISIGSAQSSKGSVPCKDAMLAVGSDLTLSLLAENPSTPAKSMVAHLSTAYNSGWLVGDCKVAWLSDTVAETLTASGELVTNGTFATDISGWTTTTAGSTTIAWSSVIGGSAQINADGTNSGQLSQGFPTVVGRVYTVTFNLNSTGALFRIGTTLNSSNIFSSATLVGSTVPYAYTFTATTTTTYITFVRTSSGSVYIDSVSCRVAVADRGFYQGPITVYGTVTKTAVATGAQLMGFSGFSASNYLEQPYNANLDFGTGDFSVAGWFKAGANATAFMYSRGPSGGGATTVDVFQNGTGYIVGRVAGVSVTGTVSLSDGNWHHVVVQRVSGTAYVYVDGVLVGSAAAAGTVTNTSATCRIGLQYDSTNPYNGSLSLWRVSATTFSVDQINQAYRDEYQLFQPGAMCTLDGTNLSILALAYDDTADILHVATTWGRTAFHNLLRVESAATSVGTQAALAAVGGNHITAGSTSARYTQASVTLREELRRKYEARAAMARQQQPIWYTGDGTTTAFTMPLGTQPQVVYRQGLIMRDQGNDYSLTYDGYRWTVTFVTAPGNNHNICFMGVKNV